MNTEYNFYCDESLHLPNDGSKVMVLGGIWCPKNKVKSINRDIRDIKRKHNIYHEMKWVKVSESKKDAYLDIVKYFFECKDLHFRVLVVDNKDKLNHELFKQSHDEWYFKMYFRMIKTILDPLDIYNIYLDIKDTQSKTKIQKLKNVLENSRYDFSKTMIKNMQVIRSDEVEIMQLVDILIGALAYVSRNMSAVQAKNEIIEYIKEKSGYSLKKNTP